ncbi:MAG: kelch repeat-containing protein [Bdellovibrionota bacterium]|nr:kelch repeat-containing protein [Bdellovibrionota bacterium]
MKLIMSLILLFTVQINAAEMILMKEEADKKELYSFDLENFHFQKVDTKTTIAIYPSLSKDGKLLSFSGGESLKSLSLHLINRGSNFLQKIEVENYGLVLHSQISANQKWIVFSAMNLKTHQFDVLSYEIESGDIQTVLSSEDKSYYFPKMTSDSFHIFAQESLSKNERYLVKKHLGEDKIERINTSFSNCMAPSLSFDDQFLAYTCKLENQWQVYEMLLKDKSTRLVSGNEHEGYAPQYDANQNLYFASPRENHFQVFKSIRKNKNLDSPELLLAGDGFDLYSPSISGNQSYVQSNLENMPKPNRSSFGSIVVNDNLYVIGGHKGREHTYPPESFSDRVDRYDFINKTWQELTPRPVKAHGYGLARCGDYIYAFGGFAYSANHLPKWKSLKRVDRYDIKNNQWTKVAELPRPRSSNAVIKLDNKIYLVGGWDSTPKFKNDIDGRFHDEIDVFDCATEEMITSDLKLPGPKRRAFTGINYQGKLMLIGGISEGGHEFNLLKRVDLFDPKTKKNKILPDLPFATFAPAAGNIENDVYVFGGMFHYGDWNYNYVNHVYHFDGKKWQHSGRYLKRTKGFSQVSRYKNKLIIAGGHSYEGGFDEPVSDVETWEQN